MIGAPARGASPTDRAIAGPEAPAARTPTELVSSDPAPYPPVLRKPETALLSQCAPFISENRHRTESSLETDLISLAGAHERRIQQPTVLPLAAAVSGGGVTTLLAGLGRALSILGERVLLVDANAPSPLDYFYRRYGQESGFMLSTPVASTFEGQVHLLRTDVDAPCAAQSWSTRVHRALAELRGRFDRILVAGRDALTSALSEQARANGLFLVVLTPELRSLLAVPSILKRFSEHSAGANTSMKPAFLLNRFDENNPAHSEIRKLLAVELGSQLLPFHIPESRTVAEALADRVTPLDLAPQSAFTESCFTLAEWYRAQLDDLQSLSSRPEENQLVSD